MCIYICCHSWQFFTKYSVWVNLTTLFDPTNFSDSLSWLNWIWSLVITAWGMVLPDVSDLELSQKNSKSWLGALLTLGQYQAGAKTQFWGLLSVHKQGHCPCSQFLPSNSEQISNTLDKIKWFFHLGFFPLWSILRVAKDAAKLIVNNLNGSYHAWGY